MKHLLLFTFLILFHVSNSQTYYWSDLFGGDGFDFSNLVAIDVDGNVYNSGFYREGNFQIGDSVLPFVDNMDSYFAKFSSSGEMLWVIPLYGTGVFDRTEAMCLDNNGDVYLLSTIQEEYNIGDQEHIVIPEENNIDILLMKFSPEGNLYWYKIFNGPGDGLAYNMVINGTNIYMVGHFNDTLYMDDIELYANTQDMFVASLDMSGNVNWAKSFGGNGYDRLYAVDIHENSDLAVCGYSFGNFQFGNTHLDSVDGVMYHTFVGRLDASGNPIWAAQTLNEFKTEAPNIATDGVGNSYISYYDQYYENFRIARFSSEGAIDWDYISENSTDTLGSLAYDVKYTANKLYVTGYLSKGNILFGEQYDEVENTDYLLAAVHPEDGTLDTLFHDGGAGKLKSYGLFIDNTGSAILSMLANGPVTVNSSNLGNANNDILLVKLDISGLIISTEEVSIQQNEVILYPNPVNARLSFKHVPQQAFEKIVIYDPLGKQVAEMDYSETIGVDGLNPGYYLLRLTGKSSPVTLTFVKE